MTKFRVDFEFSTDGNRTYWLPLALEAPNLSAAEDLATKFKVGLSQKFEVQQFGPAYENSALSARLRKAGEGYRSAKIERLYVNEHRFVVIEGISSLTVYENFEIAALASGEVLPGDEEIIARIRRREFPARLIRGEDVGNVNEVLVINVLAP